MYNYMYNYDHYIRGQQQKYIPADRARTEEPIAEIHLVAFSLYQPQSVSYIDNIFK